jgi:hypothetical protein
MSPFSSGQPDSTPHKRITSRNRRCCCGRLSRRSCAVISLVVALTLVIFTLIAYLAVIPAVIRDKIASQDLNQIRLERMQFRDFGDTSFRFSMRAILPPQFPLPLTARLSPFTLNIQHASKQSALLDVLIPGFDITLNSDIPLDWEAEASFKQADLLVLQKMIADFSSDSGLAPFDLAVRTAVDISLFGITFYPQFQIERFIPIPQIRSYLDEVMAAMPAFMKQPELSIFSLFFVFLSF